MSDNPAPEASLIHPLPACGKYWSILCPEYPHAGSGWFRIRWVYAAIQKSVLLSSQKDLDALGLPKVNVEQLGDAELEDYANQLSETVLSYMWTKDVFDTRIREIVEAVGENLTISSQPTVGISKQTALF